MQGWYFLDDIANFCNGREYLIWLSCNGYLVTSAPLVCSLISNLIVKAELKKTWIGSPSDIARAPLVHRRETTKFIKKKNDPKKNNKKIMIT